MRLFRTKVVWGGRGGGEWGFLWRVEAVKTRVVWGWRLDGPGWG